MPRTSITQRGATLGALRWQQQSSPSMPVLSQLEQWQLLAQAFQALLCSCLLDAPEMRVS